MKRRKGEKMSYKTQKEFKDTFDKDLKGKSFFLSSTGPHAVGDEFKKLLGKKIDNKPVCDLREIYTEIKTKFKMY